MPYLPKSKVTVKYSNGELQYTYNYKVYNGPYIETSEGKYYEGTSNTNFGEELILLTNKNAHVGDPFGISKDVKKLHIIKPGLKSFFQKIRLIPTSKPFPTPNDYIKGYFKRYFRQRVNGSSFQEISRDTYDSIINQEGKYDHYLYKVGSLIWYIKGPNVHKLNSMSLLKSNRSFPLIISLFPILNEYQDTPNKVIENQNTNGGELYYSDGTEYIGPYHIHPSRGPMVGITHSTEPHSKLYYLKDLPLPPNQSYEEFQNNYNKLTCYKCKNINGVNSIFTSQVSRMLGCPENSYTSHEEAEYSCFQEEETEEIKGKNDEPTATPSGGSNTPSGGGGGTSSGGGGGY